MEEQFLEGYNTSHKFWDQSPSPHYQCCLQVSETVSWHKFRCRYSANILQHWVGGRGLIYFCKVDNSRIFINFSRNWLGLNNLREILRVQGSYFCRNLMPWLFVLGSSYHDFIFSASQCHGFVSSKNISWFLDVTALWSLFLDVLVFRPLVKCLGISILLGFLSSILNLVAFCPKISILKFFLVLGLDVMFYLDVDGMSMSCFICIGVLTS